jgi:hypothetical protein
MRKEPPSRRETSQQEFDDLTKEFELAQQKREELEKVQKSFLTLTTPQEAEALFDNKIKQELKKECSGKSCYVMGGRKSYRRKERRRGRKSCRRRGRR